MEIIPAIDIIDGKCVRLSQGNFSRRKTYDVNPLEAAKRFESAGFKRLHIVDLDGAKSGSLRNLNILESIAAATGLQIDFGGGVRSDSDVERVFEAGAQVVSVGSMAIRQPEMFSNMLANYGGERFLLGADVRNGKVAVDGWQSDSNVDLLPFLADYHNRGVVQAFVTDINKDGELGGPAVELYKKIRDEIPSLMIIASGGVVSISDVESLRLVGCAGVIIGKAIYEGRIGLDELARYVS
jgi:phosphoribosylformimino-5-aminoimidazole carboxamide ribotide isomerase